MQTPYDRVVDIYGKAGLTSGLSYRASMMRADKGDAGSTELNLYPWTIMSEQPAMVFDWNLMRVVREVVLMKGVRINSIGKIVLLDSHNRHSCRDCIGHAHTMRDHRAGGFKAKVADVVFAESDLAIETRKKVDGGHLWDGSAGYLPIEFLYLNKKDKMKVGDIVYEGPMKLTTVSEVNEFSVTPIGADNLAKVHRALQQVFGARSN